ncbi:MAG: hypothetical protein ACXVGM_20065 [Oryzihumus sp.]
MKPLQSLAMGLLVIAMSARFHGYDALPDPVGWLLVLLGVRGLPTELDHRATLRSLALLAGAVSVVLWFPAVTTDLYDADASLGWAANLPQLAFTALLAHALASRAAAAGDGRSARWLGITRTAIVVVGLLPVLVFGAGVSSLEVTSYLAAGITALLLIWLLFAYASRPWAAPVLDESPTGPASPS